MNELDELTTKVLETLSTRDDKGQVVAFDIERLDVVIAELRASRKLIAEENKKSEKAIKELAKEEQSEIGKAYYNSLKVGDEFSYRMADGTIKVLRKIETKSKSNATAAGELVVPEGKTPNRYPKFHQVIVPAANEETDDDASKEEVVA